MDTTLLQADSAQALREFVQGIMFEKLNTCVPGEIMMFDPALQTAIVRCCVRLAIITDAGERKTMERCPLVDVPVLFPYSTSSGFSLTYPVCPGDQCLLLFSQEGLDRWQEYGSVQDPPGTGAARHFDYTDAIAILGVIPKPWKIPQFSMDGVEMRNKDRSTYVHVEENKIEQKAVSPNGNILHEISDKTLGTKVSSVIGQSGQVVETKSTTGAYSLVTSLSETFTAPSVTVEASEAFSVAARNAAIAAEQGIAFTAASIAGTAQTYTITTPDYYVANGAVAARSYIALQGNSAFTGITKTGNGATTLAFVNGICVKFGNE